MGYAFVYIILALFCRPVIFAQELTRFQFTTIIPSVTEIVTAKITQGNDTSNLDILAPSSPRNLTIKNATDTSLTLQWQIPDKPNGLLRGYRIYFTQGNYTDTRTDKTNPEQPVKTYILNELKPDTVYSIQVKAFSAKHEGNLSAPALGRTDIMGPSPPILTNISCEYNNSIMVEFNRSARFPDSIDEYYIDIFESGVLIQHMDLPTEKNFISSSYVFHNITPKVRYEVQVYAASKSNRTGNLVKGEKSRLESVFVAEGCLVPSEHLTELWAGILAGFLCAVGVLLLGGGGYLIWRSLM